jgi:hypothetical protein
MRVTGRLRRDVSDNRATELRDSGRYVAQVTVPSGAYASARKAVRAQASAPQAQATDFQLVGHN